MAKENMAAGKPRIGRPPKYSSPEEMQIQIDKYFMACEGHLYTDKDGIAILDKYGQPVIIGAKPPTVTGLSLAIGFRSRQALINYMNRDKAQAGDDDELAADDFKTFYDTLTRAKARIEEYNETRLYDRDGVNGAKFSLVNNFKSWKEKADGADVNANATIKITLTDD